MQKLQAQNQNIKFEEYHVYRVGKAIFPLVSNLLELSIAMKLGYSMVIFYWPDNRYEQKFMTISMAKCRIIFSNLFH